MFPRCGLLFRDVMLSCSPVPCGFARHFLPFELPARQGHTQRLVGEGATGLALPTQPAWVHAWTSPSSQGLTEVGAAWGAEGEGGDSGGSEGCLQGAWG